MWIDMICQRRAHKHEDELGESNLYDDDDDIDEEEDN